MWKGVEGLLIRHHSMHHTASCEPVVVLCHPPVGGHGSAWQRMAYSTLRCDASPPSCSLAWTLFLPLPPLIGTP